MSALVTGRLPDSELIRNSLEQVAQHGILGDADATILDVGTGAFLTYFEREILDDLVAQGGATCRFFEGSYGAGKTHLLHLLGELALSRGMATVQTELSQDLGLEDWHQITQYVLQNLEVRIEGSRVRGLPRILDALRQSGKADVTALKGAPLPHVGFRNAIVRAMTDPEVAPLLDRYLLGDKVSASQLRYVRVVRTGHLQQVRIEGVKDPLSRRNAELALNTVLGALFHLGIPGTMLLFDENERTLVSGRTTLSIKLRIAANLMRRLVDGCTTGGLTGTVVVFAVLPGFLDNCTRQYPALGQRLEMMRGQEQAPAWRWPVLPIDAVSTTRHQECFLKQAVIRLTQLVVHCGGDVDGLEDRLHHEGNEVLREHAGSDFRRPLMKRLATVAFMRLDEEY